MVDADCRKRQQGSLQLVKLACINVELDMPTNKIKHTSRERIQVFDRLRAAALQIEPNCSHAFFVKSNDLCVGNRCGQLRDTDKLGAKTLKCTQEVTLIECLEGTRDNRPRRNAQWTHIP